MFLLDTELVWALRSARAPGGHPALTQWVAEQARTGLFISALTLAELGAAAAQVERADRAAAGAVRRWIDDAVAAAFEGNILPVDAAIGRRAATLGYPHLRDGLFAATALEHGLTIATRMPATFRPGKVKTVDPWTHAPVADGEDGDWRQASRAGPVWLRNLFARG